MSGLQLGLAQSTLAGFLLALARTAGFVVLAPPFNTRAVPQQARVITAVALALPVSAVMARSAPAFDGSAIVLDVMGQVLVGLVLGYLVMVAVAVVQSVGDLLDAIGGFQISMALDPLMLVQTSVMGRLHQLVAVTLLFVTDGHLMVVHGLARSMATMPAPGLHWDKVAQAVTASVGGLLGSAVEVAAPVMAAMLVTDVALGLLTRAAPALNAFSLGFPLKILFTLLLAGVVVTRLPDVLAHLVPAAVLSGIGLTGG